MSIALLHQRIWSAKAVCPQKLTKVKCVATARYAIARTTKEVKIADSVVITHVKSLRSTLKKAVTVEYVWIK